MSSIKRTSSGVCALALLLAACGDAGSAGGDAAQGGGDSFPETAMENTATVLEDGDTAAAWANSIAAQCVAEAGEDFRERCECMAQTVTDGKTPGEIVALTDEDRKAAADQC